MTQSFSYTDSLGYKHIVLTGLSGGGWVTTVTAAIDPRIKLSIPIAGTVPKWPTALYPFEVPDLPELAGDFEQHYERSIYKECGFVCMYVLASLEEGRSSAQILHDQDPCCYSAHVLHDEIKEYNKFVQQQEQANGWMQTFVTDGNIHQVNLRDKVVVSYLVEKLRKYGAVYESDMKWVPFDVLN